LFGLFGTGGLSLSVPFPLPGGGVDEFGEGEEDLSCSSDGGFLVGTGRGGLCPCCILPCEGFDLIGGGPLFGPCGVRVGLGFPPFCGGGPPGGRGCPGPLADFIGPLGGGTGVGCDAIIPNFPLL